MPLVGQGAVMALCPSYFYHKGYFYIGLNTATPLFVFKGLAVQLLCPRMVSEIYCHAVCHPIIIPGYIKVLPLCN